jgi:hypothetical protein
MSILGIGRFEIVNHYDYVQTNLTGYIDSNHGTHQTYNTINEKYIPDYTNDNLILTARVVRMNVRTNILDTEDLIEQYWEIYKDKTWKRISNSNTHILKVNENLSTEENYRFYRHISRIRITEEQTEEVILTYQLCKLLSDMNEIEVRLEAINGTIFSELNRHEELPIDGYIYDGANLVTNLSHENIRWFIKHNEGSGNLEFSVEKGWSEFKVEKYQINNNFTRLSLVESDITSIDEIMLVYKDLSNNFTYKNTIFINDALDSIPIFIESSGGDMFRNGNESSRLTARVFKNNQEVDNQMPTSAIYKWSKIENSSISLFSSTSNNWIRSGKTIFIDRADVNFMTNFICEARSISTIKTYNEVILKTLDGKFVSLSVDNGTLKIDELSYTPEEYEEVLYLTSIDGNKYKITYSTTDEFTVRIEYDSKIVSNEIYFYDNYCLYELMVVDGGRIELVDLNINAYNNFSLTSPSGYNYMITVSPYGEITSEKIYFNTTNNEFINIKSENGSVWKLTVDDWGAIKTTKVLETPQYSFIKFLLNKKIIFEMYVDNYGAIYTEKKLVIDDSVQSIVLQTPSEQNYLLKMDKNGDIVLLEDKNATYNNDVILDDEYDRSWKVSLSDDLELITEPAKTSIGSTSISIQSFESSKIFSIYIDTLGSFITEEILI